MTASPSSPRDRWSQARLTLLLWARRLGLILLGAFLALAVTYVAKGPRKADLKAWHRWSPEGEYRAGKGAPQTFAEYRSLEVRLFTEVRAHFAERDQPQGSVNRYNESSALCPWRFADNHNRSFLLEPSEIRGGVLLLHGLSDSPHSLHALGEVLADHGYLVLGLRLPGHGTTPAALLSARMEDWRGATQLAVRELQSRLDQDQPWVMVGYSNGAALALDYSLESLGDPSLPTPNQMIMLSPALVVTKAAAFARTLSLLRYLPGLEAQAWNTVQPEFDPYKYNSFTLNAATQIYRLTTRVEKSLKRVRASTNGESLPSILAFQSLVDATIPTVATLERLLGAMEHNGSHVVLFDVNTAAQTRSLLAAPAEALRRTVLQRENLPFKATLVGNRSPDTQEVVRRFRLAGRGPITLKPTDLIWPKGVYSLSHVALPFPPEDTIYGREAIPGKILPLGSLELRGERGALLIPTDLQLRLRYNPFFPLVEKEVLSFLGVEEP